MVHVSKCYLESKDFILIDDIQKGVYLRISRPIIKALAASRGQKDLPLGVWKVIRVKDPTRSTKSALPGFTPYKIIYILHETWTRRSSNPISLRINASSQAIVGGELFDEVGKAVVRDWKDLATINEDRWTCIICGNVLNVVASRCRICNTCEKNNSPLP